jgi:hypothetical protein
MYITRKMKKELIVLLLIVSLTACAPRMTGQSMGEVIAPCTDSDGGANFEVPGVAQDYYVKNHDYCLGDSILYEGVCGTVQRAGYILHVCEDRCFRGACK